MSLLTAPQKAAIAAGAAIRQVIALLLPESAGAAWSITNLIHDDASATLYVTDAGRRDVSAYNVSFREPGTLAAARWIIKADNSSGVFSPYATTNVWQTTYLDPMATPYSAVPRECGISHYVYVLVSGAWSEITGVRYLGRVADPSFNETDKTVEIASESIISDVLRREWTTDDGEDIETGLEVDV